MALVQRVSMVGVMLVGLLVSWLAVADEVVLDDGSKLVGQAEALADGKLQFRTSFAGTLVIDWVRVVTLETSQPALAGLKPVKPAVPEPAVETTGRVWNYELAFNLAGRQGNTDKREIGGSAVATLKGQDDTLKLYLRTERTKIEGEETSESMTGGVDYERMIGQLSSWYVRSELHRDDFRDIDLRWTTAAGMGHYLYRQPKHSLKGRVGLFYTHERYDDPPFGSGQEALGSEDKYGVELGAHHMLEVNDWMKVVTDLLYMPDMSDFGDFRATHETAVDVPIAGSALWKLRMGIGHEYESQPANDRDRLDTYYFVRLVLNWQQGKFLESAGLKK